MNVLKKTDELYPTRKVEVFKKAKEFRTDYLNSLLTAHERGKKILLTNCETLWSLWSGFHNLQIYWPAGHVQDISATKPERTIEYLDELEKRGFRAICAWLMVPIGEMLHPEGEIKPDFAATHHVCEPMGKASQVFDDLFGIPTRVIETPQSPDPKRLGDVHLKFLVDQLHEAIEWMEKVSGEKCDDEALCEGIRNEIETEVLAARVLEFNKAVPAPLDLRLAAVLTWPAWVEARRNRTVAYFRELYDEVKQRVAEGIAAVPNEKVRLFHEAAPPFPNMKLLNLGYPYGAVFMGGSVIFIYPCAFKVTEDYSLVSGQTLEERGITLRTRDDALRAIADQNINNLPVGPWMSVTPRKAMTLKAMKDWHADGAVFHLDHGCQGMPAAGREVQLALKEAGYPTLMYEGNSVDPRGIVESQIADAFESFYAALGLKKGY